MLGVMEHRRHILPSSYPHNQLSLDEHSRTRQPLTDSAGNANLQALSSVGLYQQDQKRPQQIIDRIDRPIYAIPPTLPSQPARSSLGSTLELRKQNNRRRRYNRHSRNPIVDSPQYQAYRARMNRDGNPEDAKWPELLELAFLDALIEIPPMGRRKYSYKGKPHGRNELIKEYLWIAYLQTLAPGQRPDESMQRTRKQVSSHIQVIKGFLRDHPAYERLFPSNKGPKNGFEDSFKNDPCLKALSEGRLPTKRYEQYENINHMIVTNQSSIHPTCFWILIASSSIPNEINGRLKSEGDLYREGVVAHKFTGLSSQRRRNNLDSITNWRQRYPYLEQLHNVGDLNCEIIHMDVSLDLMAGLPPDGSELFTRIEMSMAGRDTQDCQWQAVTSLIKPPQLYRDPLVDIPMDSTTLPMDVLGVSDTETRLKVPFPATAWAHTFTRLAHIQLGLDSRRKPQTYPSESIEDTGKTIREHVEQISMYQELQSSAGSRVPFMRRAIVLWTFHKARPGEGSGTTWRHLDPYPPRHTCMSPPPHPGHAVSAAMSETFNAWVEAPLHLQQSHAHVMEPFVQGLITPPHTGGLQSPFGAAGFAYPGQPYDITSESLSFVSNATVDGDAGLVDNETSVNIDNILSSANILGDYDHASSWHMPPSEGFDAESAWANYTVSSGTPQLPWESEKQQTSWSSDAHIKDGWTESHAHVTPSKQPDHQHQIYLDDQKLQPWMDPHDTVGKNTYSDLNSDPQGLSSTPTRPCGHATEYDFNALHVHHAK